MNGLLTPLARSEHSPAVAAQSATGFGDPHYPRRNAPQRRFFIASSPAYGGVQWEDFGPAGFLGYRFANPLHPVTRRLATSGGGSYYPRSLTHG